MKWLHIFWVYLNWLEFTTFIVLPIAVLLLTLVYIYFNLRLIRLSMEAEMDELSFMTSLTNKLENYEASNLMNNELNIINNEI